MTRDFAKKSRPPAANSRSSTRASSSRKSSYANKKRPGNRPKSKVPGWVWLFTGTVLGAFIMFLAYLSGVAPQPSSPTPVAAASQPEKVKAQVPKPRFDFYQLLKETEVVVKDTTPAPKAQTKPSEQQEFILQVGSFKKSADADRLRAELILMNLQAQVETVTVRNGETWHRVLVGPYDSSSKVASARSKLVSNDINPLLLKRKKG